jgi:hypothetical protein
MKILQRFRWARGSWLDPFRNTPERVFALDLIATYEEDLQLILEATNFSSIKIAVSLANLPEKIRGFGHVRTRHADVVGIERIKLRRKAEKLSQKIKDNYTEIKKRLKVGGNLIGIIPDPTRLDYALEHGIHVSHVSDKELSVWIPDTPYYTNGPVSEPLVHSKDLIEKLEDIGFKCVLYGDSFSMYSKFVFKLVSK